MRLGKQYFSSATKEIISSANFKVLFPKKIFLIENYLSLTVGGSASMYHTIFIKTAVFWHERNLKSISLTNIMNTVDSCFHTGNLKNVF